MKKQILAPSILALFVASAAHAGATFDTAAGTLNIGADVEFDYTSETDVNMKSSGRLLLDINGEKVLEDGTFAGFKLNPTWGQNGARGADDVWFKFGVKNDWSLQAGHFEAADLSPAGQDTYVAEVSADRSKVTMYRAKDARGRQDDADGGQITLNKTMDATGLELTLQSKDSGDTVIARPVMTYAMDSVSFAVGAEVPVVAKSDNDSWYGVGATTTLQASDDLALTVRAAYKSNDDTNIDSMTAGIGAQYQNFFAGVLYGQDDVDNGATTDETQIYASYKIPAIMDIDNFDIYLGAGYAIAENSDDDVYGGRVRFKYIF